MSPTDHPSNDARLTKADNYTARALAHASNIAERSNRRYGCSKAGGSRSLYGITARRAAIVFAPAAANTCVISGDEDSGATSGGRKPRKSRKAASIAVIGTPNTSLREPKNVLNIHAHVLGLCA